MRIRGGIISPKRAIRKGYIHLTRNSKVQQVGIDITSADTKEIKKGDWALLRIQEYLSLPRYICGFIIPRSTCFRKGIIVKSGLCDPGYKGHPRVAIFPYRDVLIKQGYRLAQIVFVRAHSASVYRGQYQEER